MATAHALVPGHVTGFFGVHRAETPHDTGSIGGGIAVGDPIRVEVTVETEQRTDGGVATGDHQPGRVRFEGRSLTIDPIARLADRLGVTMDISVESPFPLGVGFGVSGAVTLGAALAATRAADLAHTETTIVEHAHVAEVAAATGLGDVVAQARGGVPLRVEPGAGGRLDGLPAAGRIEYLVLGDLSTPAVLEGETDAITAAGERALERVRADPTMATFAQAARTFASEADLVTEAVDTVIADVTDAGGQAFMSMLGETVVALGTGLSDAGYDPTVTRIDPAGARLESGGF